MKNISIEEMKQIQIDILKDIHRFCEEKGIRYSLSYGTLIGAVRHKGFIPWDDDIDISMPRPDYEKFIKDYKHPFFYVYDHRKDADYPLLYAKVADTRTMLEENVSMKNIGINIDIFPTDYLFDTVEECLSFIQKLNVVKKFFRIKLIKPGYKNVWWKRILIRLGKLALFPISIKSLAAKEQHIVDTLTNQNVLYAANICGSSVLEANKTIFSSKIYDNLIKVPFEQEEFFIFADYDPWLRQMYGDYMTPPSGEGRTSPHTLNKIYWL